MNKYQQFEYIEISNSLLFLSLTKIPFENKFTLFVVPIPSNLKKSRDKNIVYFHWNKFYFEMLAAFQKYYKWLFWTQGTVYKKKWGILFLFPFNGRASNTKKKSILFLRCIQKKNQERACDMETNGIN